MYGPTEATIWVSISRVLAGAPIELGQPLPGARMCLAGEDGRPVTEPQRPGELLLYGTGLAEGYLNRAELTAERFLTCPTPDGPQRCYRTGDLAQYRPDGSLHFLGRADGQIKLRGHRIELSEIEAVAEEQPGIVEAAAILRDVEDSERTHIALFVVTDGTRDRPRDQAVAGAAAAAADAAGPGADRGRAAPQHLGQAGPGEPGRQPLSCAVAG